MNKHAVAAYFLLGILLFLPSCGSSSNTAQPSLQLTSADSGGSFTLHRGDTLKLSLQENGSTGYIWEFTSRADSILQYVGEEFVADSNQPGAGGMRTYTFKATAAGTAPLQLINHRPWETGVPPAQTFEATITVEQ